MQCYPIMWRLSIFSKSILLCLFCFVLNSIAYSKEIDVIEPKLEFIESGDFLMGDLTQGTRGKWKESPVHKVKVDSFYLSRFEVTFEEWDRCTMDEVCVYAEDQGWGRQDRPVINVSWNDIQVYIKWLNIKSSKDYRLPTESEWEYAARAGSETVYSTGSCISTEQANYNGYGDCGRGKYRKQTLEVDSFKPNAFGLYNMNGNAWEWLQDCWHGSYQKAPVDSRAWLQEENGNCEKRVLRGGSWHSQSANIRSATRIKDPVDYRAYHTGFRLAHSAADPED